MEATLTAAEVVADVAMKGHLLEAIPFVGMAFKSLKALDTVRDVLYAEKLRRFLDGVGPGLSAAELARLQDDAGEARKAGETLLLILDRLTDLDKPELLGHLVRQFAAGRIEAIELRRLAVAVDVGFADDLRELLRPDDVTDPQEVRERLVAAGLARIHIGLTHNSDGDVTYHLTELGSLLFHVVNGERSAEPSAGASSVSDPGI